MVKSGKVVLLDGEAVEGFNAQKSFSDPKHNITPSKYADVGGVLFAGISFVLGFCTFVFVWVLLIQESLAAGFAFGWIPALFAGFIVGFFWSLALFAVAVFAAYMILR